MRINQKLILYSQYFFHFDRFQAVFDLTDNHRGLSQTPIINLVGLKKRRIKFKKSYLKKQVPKHKHRYNTN